ncbi:hypothetical protein A3B35_01535 [Candidatus Kaiserbacteria bacterium RIFCSPLOWO2_01_FULL_54_24]|uniref:DUF1003 domain-containing protein n=1 Tax=Candidatus Kaiserbacteria bacterium RIFCSPLOWO2_01_FULL_54_24 TaxID=1798515 RepID=A0A1F6ETP6_9BACT|nr:MAG: hypothetical protein A3B35_01535 [Candidatus Kaiserbacteria bacterium RIFCSPLOWO2_01_FULL_54_24]
MKDPYQIRKTALSVTRWIGSPASIAVHTVAFLLSFIAVGAGWLYFDRMLLILTTVVSLEAIYLAIFIQMTINLTTQELEEVGEDIEELQENIGEIQENVGELQEDVEEISVDVGEMTEEEAGDEAAEEARKNEQKKTLTDIQTDLRRLMQDIARLQKNGAPHGTPPPQQNPSASQ